MHKLRVAVGLFALAAPAFAADKPVPTFKTIQLTDKFYCEGAHFADFNRDGRMDVVSGPFWYEGPDFQKKHEYRPVQAFDPLQYSDNFLTFTYDFNGDGWTDILCIGFPGKEAFWYQNPGAAGGPWRKNLAYDVVDNESPTLGDITGDGKPELIFNTGGRLGYAEPDWNYPDRPWKFTAISPKGNYQRFTHGLGYGDVNGDGKPDLLEANGWWEHPAQLDPNKTWTKHSHPFGDAPCQMYAYDVDGDGLNDVISVEHAHQYGLGWHRQIRKDGQIAFEFKRIMGKTNEENPQGIKITQCHGMELADIDGDGLKDIVTGKRFWAHGPKGDAEPDAPAVLYWFQLQRDPRKGASFFGHLIHDNSGVGTQVTAGDINGDGIPDIIVGNKKGTFISVSQPAK